MKDTGRPTPHKPLHTGSEDRSEEPLHELRSLLLGPEQEKLERLQQRLDDASRRAEEIGRILPTAISLREARDNSIARALAPTIDESIRASVKKNPKVLAEAIFPALGPGIRKAITSTIMGMIQSLNQLLNHSVSVRGLKWRWEALRTRKPFAEVVLLHTLVFQVEQIFLIHRATGIVLQHVEAKEAMVRDPDLVSGMLTAIQDFVKDSFQTEEGETLETLRMGGGRSLWIEDGPQALLAAVIRGTPPLHLRVTLKEMLESVHLGYSDAFERFDGDVIPFSRLQGQLEEGLQFQAKETKARISPVLWLLLVAVVAAFSIWGFYALRSHLRWEEYLGRINQEEGLVITSTGREGGKYVISGFRDPLAKDPGSLLMEAGMDSADVICHWEPYHALDHGLILLRARSILLPPDKVRFALSNETLVAEGTASHGWIRRFRTRALCIPGISAYDDTMLEDVDRERLARSIDELKAMTLYFPLAGAQIGEGQKPTLQSLLAKVREIQSLQTLLKIPAEIVIIGHTDNSGTERLNLPLSHSRAKNVFHYLVMNGASPDHISTRGVGTREPLKKGSTPEDRRLNRVVTFNAILMDSVEGVSP
ncbi:MAG: OmpA family protein [Thermodesulfobacteriota bacterium]|nr:OmpA family protein [Thermodesulfobacteriota bacterium]